MAVAGVTRLEVDSSFDLRVTLGQPEAATVTYDGNLASLLDFGVDGRTLRIRLQPHDRIGNSPNLTAQVTIGRLKAIRVAGDSTTTLSGASRLELTGIAGRLHADGSGASNLELAGLRLHDLDIQLSGASHANVQADRTIAVLLSGASHLTYTGTPWFTRRDTSGASAIQPASR